MPAFFSFTVKHQLKNSAARSGVITTAHGRIETPSYVAVGTQGTVKSLTPDELNDLKVQIFFVNTYHMMLRPGMEVINKFKGLHDFINWQGPLITDSGGFQVFSLAPLVKIDDNGATFRSHWDGSLHHLSPEKSILIQHQLNADIGIVLDDCPSYPINYDKAKISLKRNNHWAVKSLKAHQELKKRLKTKLALYGSIQGSVFPDLRRESAKFTVNLPFDGYAIGGVAVGESKTEMENVLKWVTPLLPPDKPRHLLGVGEIDDIFTLVNYGIDTFDCVMPTRLARMGQILIKNEKFPANCGIPLRREKIKNLERDWKIDITQKIYAEDQQPLEVECKCYTCTHFSRAYIYHLFKVRELLAYRLATIHNLYFIEELMGKIREGIKLDALDKVKEEYL